MIGPIETIRSFVATLWRTRRGQSRARFMRWQHNAVNKWVHRDLPRASFYKSRPNTLSACPIIDKATVMGQFDQFNTRDLDLDAAWAIQHGGGASGDITVGASTGTSGNRGLFVISEREKHRWLGAIVAKTMADLIWKPQRVAIILPSDTGLYSSANKLRFIQLKTFPLTTPPEQWRTELEAFDPSVIVAPPKVLRHFAEAEYAINPIRIFSAAETLDCVDEAIASQYFNQPLRQIYMATEGLFAVSCGQGALHLAEESVAFEFEPVGDGLVAPLVSSFRRQTQIMARYRMNDLLRLSDAPCPCGSPLQVVAEVVGRMDDMFVFGDVTITPDVLRNAVLDADRSVTDFRLVQISAREVVLHLPDEQSIIAPVVQGAVKTLLDQFNADADVTLQIGPLPFDTLNKLRRVQRTITRSKNGE